MASYNNNFSSSCFVLKGLIFAEGLSIENITVTDDYVADKIPIIWVDTSINAVVTITLPCEPCGKAFYMIKNLGPGVAIINTAGVCTVAGQANYTLCYACSSVFLSYQPDIKNYGIVNSTLDILANKGDILTHNGSCITVLPVGEPCQMLTVCPDSDTFLAWKYPNECLTARDDFAAFSPIANDVFAVSNTPIAVGFMSYIKPTHDGLTAGQLIFNGVMTGGETITIEVYNETLSASIAQVDINSSGTQILDFNVPAASSVLSIRASSPDFPTNSFISGATMEFATSGNLLEYTLQGFEVDPLFGSTETVGYMPWLDSRMNTIASGTMNFGITTDEDVTVTLRDTTNAVVLATQIAAASGFYSVNLGAFPPADARVELQVSKAGIGNATIHGVSVQFDTTLPRITYSPLTLSAVASTISYEVVGTMPWTGQYFAYVAGSGVLIFEAVIGDRDLDIRARDRTTNDILASTTVNASGFYSIPITKPSASTAIVVEIKKSAAGGIEPEVYGTLLEWNH